MLKISEEKRNGPAIILRLEGRLVGPWVAELSQVCDLMLADATNLALDLAEVSFADNSGLAALVSLNRRGVKLLRPSPFVSEQMKATHFAANVNRPDSWQDEH
jgi:ABC-type transporter Mla MlaB component